MIADYWDSWGKPSYGILKGHTAFLGNYDECKNLKTTIVGDTKFCIYAVKMNITYTRNQQDTEVCLTSNCSVERNATYPVDIKLAYATPQHVLQMSSVMYCQLWTSILFTQSTVIICLVMRPILLARCSVMLTTQLYLVLKHTLNMIVKPFHSTTLFLLFFQPNNHHQLLKQLLA